MRRIFLTIALVCALALLLAGAPRLAASLLRAPGNQAAELALRGAALGPESYQRGVASRDHSAEWSPARRSLIDLGFIHFNRARQAPAGSPEREALFEQSLAALHEGLRLSPVNPMAWLLVAAVQLELEARPEAARALQWAVRTGPHLTVQHRMRTIVGLGVWHLVDAPTRRRIVESSRATLRRDADLVARAALAAGIASDLGVRLRLLQPDGEALAEQLDAAVDRVRQTH